MTTEKFINVLSEFINDTNREDDEKERQIAKLREEILTVAEENPEMFDDEDQKEPIYIILYYKNNTTITTLLGSFTDKKSYQEAFNEVIERVRTALNADVYIVGRFNKEFILIGDAYFSTKGLIGVDYKFEKDDKDEE